MKKLILILTFIFILPAWALCPLDGESVCTISDSDMVMLQNQNTQGLNMNNGSMPSNALNIKGASSSFNRTLNQSGIRMQGNLGCQFGNCNKEKSNDFLPD